MEPFVGEIRLLPFRAAPRGWALCQSQLLPISQNTALYSLLGTTYGGDGTTNFALPDLRARVPIGTDATYRQGQKGGAEQVGLTVDQLPQHNHPVQGTLKAGGGGEFNTPNGANLANGTLKEFSPSPKNTTMQAGSVTGTLNATGGNQPHENRQPFSAMNYAIALNGIYPSFN